MATSAFDIKEVLSLGWEAFKKNALILILLFIIAFAANFIIGGISIALNIPSIISSLLATLTGSYFMLSTLRASLAASNEETPSWSVLKNDLPAFLKFFVAGLILTIIFFISAILLIIPVFFAVALFFPVPYILADKPETGIIDAFKRSWAITKGHLLTIILYMLLWILILFISMIPLGLGLLISTPMLYVSSAYVYKKLDAAASDSIETEALPVE
ncbi:MAG: DUF975 family protein [Endomicrobium sp.]|jgi:hypothetical protein|nr:DUF975 family protein [Endomicrobium sp.]